MTRQQMEAEMEQAAEREGMAIRQFNAVRRVAVDIGLASVQGKRTMICKARYGHRFGTSRTVGYNVERMQRV